MDYMKVTIYTTAAGIEPVTGRLYQIGITGTEIEDFDDFKDFLDNNKQYWDYVDDELIEQKKGETRVISYIQDNMQGCEEFIQIKNSMEELKKMDSDKKLGRLDIETDKLSEEDWANNWKKYFHSLEIGKKILVCPVWEEAPKTDRTVFRVNPGMTFGTGSHHTTKMCIEQIEKFVDSDSDVLDLGCGSGILSVISLMLGAKSATAVDIDSNCIKTAYENADNNNVSRDNYRVLSGDILNDEKLISTISDTSYDVVFANIVADVIIKLIPTVKKLLKKGGMFITSGIIEDRADEVFDKLISSGFDVRDEFKSADWICFIANP